MPLPTIAGTVRAAVQGTCSSGQKWVNVWHMRYTGGASSPGTTDIDALDAIFARIYTGTIYTGGLTWMSLCNNNVSIAQISYLALDGTSLAYVKTHSANGGVSGASTPAECAMVLTLRSAVRGRSHRGRVYLPQPAQGNLSADGRFQASYRDQFLVQVNAAKAALGGATVAPFWELGVASYKLSAFSSLASPTMDLDVDVQRRRKS